MNLGAAKNLQLGYLDIRSVFFRDSRIWDRYRELEGYLTFAKKTFTERIGNNISLSGNGRVGLFFNQGDVGVYEIYENQFTERPGLEFPRYESSQLNELGNRVVLGGFSDSNPRGTVAVYEWKNQAWQQVGQSLQGIDRLAQAGQSVSISGNGMTIAFTEGSYAGWQYVRVFDFNLLDWIERPSLPPQFGGYDRLKLNSVGDIVAISSLGKPGAVDVWQFGNNQWIRLGSPITGYNDEFDRGNEQSFDGAWAPSHENFGDSISLNPIGDTIAISAPRNIAEGIYYDPPNFVNWRARGKVRVYQYNGTDWQKKGSDLIAPFSRDTNYNGTFKNLGFGYTVQIDSSGDKVLVSHGRTRGDGFIGVPGHVLYEFTEGNWVYKATLPHAASVSASKDFSRLALGNQFDVKVLASGWTPSTLPNNLLAFYRLNDAGDGTLSLLDTSGNSRTLTNTNATALASGAFQGAASFTGSSQFLTATIPFNPAQPYTISMWVNVASLRNYFSIFAGSVAGTLNIHGDSSGGLSWNNALSADFSQAAFFATNQWMHCVFVRGSANAMTVYKNGSLVKTATSSTNYGSPALVDIGNVRHMGGFQFSGKIDAVGIWDRALSTAEIAQLYNNGAGMEI